MTCEEFNEISGALVLRSATAEEQTAGYLHLQSCEHCTQIWQELRTIVDLLPLAVPQVSPSAEAREHLFAQVRREAGVVAPQRPARRRSLQRSWLIAAIALLLCLCVGLSGWNIMLQREASELQERTMQIFPLQGVKNMAGATGKLVYMPYQDLTVIVLYGLPDLQGSEVYQGWLMQQNKPTSMGLFFLQNGEASLTYKGTIASFDWAAVSLEPGPTPSPEGPSGPLVAMGSLR
jgi:hypothetical protein